MVRFKNSSRFVQALVVAAVLSLFGGGVAYAASTGTPTPLVAAGQPYNTVSVYAATSGCPSGEVKPHLVQSGTAIAWKLLTAQCQQPDTGFIVMFGTQPKYLPSNFYIPQASPESASAATYNLTPSFIRTPNNTEYSTDCYAYLETGQFRVRCDLVIPSDKTSVAEVIASHEVYGPFQVMVRL